MPDDVFVEVVGDKLLGRPSLPVVEGEKRDCPVSTLPLRSISCLNFKSQLDTTLLDINGHRPSGKRNRNIRFSLPWRPDIIEVIVDGHVLIMQRCPQIKGIEPVNFLLKQVSNCLHRHDVVQHSGELHLIRIKSCGWIDSIDGENIPTAPCDIAIIQQLETEELSLLDDDRLLGKDNHITQSESSASSIGSQHISLLRPLKGNIHLELSTFDNDRIISQNFSFLLGIPIVEGWLGVEDDIRGRLVVLEGNVVQLRNLFLDACESSVELILFAERVLAYEVEMGCAALQTQRGLQKHKSEDGEC